jgi:hypothetical protein
MRSYGGLFGNNFRCLSLTFVAMVLLVLLGCTEAHRFEAYDLPAIQWACEPFLEANQNIEVNHNDHPMKEKTRELCMKLRGGKGTDDNVIVIDEKNVEGTAEISNSSMEESNITFLEREKKSYTETDSTKSDDSSIASSSYETEELNGDDRDATTIGEDDSPSDERNYVPSAAPTSASTDSKTEFKYSVFQEGDGHETDPDGIPSRYLKMQNDRRDLAKAALEKTIEWRKANEIDTILARPHPKFDVSKAVFPHYFCGRDDTQHVILLQRPGLMNVKLAHKNNLSGEDLLLHYIYVMEYLWRIVDPSPVATMTSIIDLTEMNISILRKREQLRIGTLFLSTMDAHFPQRSHQTYLINAPKWFGALYKLASPLLRESTKQKIHILSKGKEQDEVLKHLLQDCPIPEGEKHENVPAGIMEEELRNFVSLFFVSLRCCDGFRTPRYIRSHIICPLFLLVELLPFFF